MIKLKNILTESRVDHIDKNKALEIFRKNCHYYNAQLTRIYRGAQRPVNYATITTPSQYTRESANTLNYYTMLIDNAPNWGMYPKRSKSIICSTSPAYARDYGTLYVVIPFKGSNIGVCPEKDIWESFTQSISRLNMGTLHALNMRLSDAYLELRGKGLNGDPKQLSAKPAEFFKQLKNFDKPECKEFLKTWKKYTGDFEEWAKSDMGFTEYLFKLLDPTDNLFTHRLAEKFVIPSFASVGREVWTDGDSLLIPEANINDFLTTVLKKGHSNGI